MPPPAEDTGVPGNVHRAFRRVRNEPPERLGASRPAALWDQPASDEDTPKTGRSSIGPDA
jgi:hypothetical protein